MIKIICKIFLFLEKKGIIKNDFIFNNCYFNKPDCVISMLPNCDKTEEEKRIAFLDYFSKQLFIIFQEKHVFLSVRQNNGQCWLHYNDYLEGKSSLTDTADKIKDLLVSQHAQVELPGKILGHFIEKINQLILVDAPQEIRQCACKHTEVWLKRSTSVFTDEVSFIEKILSYASSRHNEEAMYDILTLSSSSLVNIKKLQSENIENMINICARHFSQEKMIKVFNTFFSNHYIENSGVELLIRDSILKHFPDHIDEFYSLPCIEQYIMQYNDNDIVIPTDEIISLSLKIDCRKIYNYIDISAFGLKESQQLLQLMAEALKQTVNSTHIQDIIIHHYQQKDENGKKEYKYSYLIANITAQYGATPETINKEMLNEWMKHMLWYCKNNKDNLAQMIGNNSSKILKGVLFSSLLDKKLDIYNDNQNVSEDLTVKMKI
jgi:hypothetical protein